MIRSMTGYGQGSAERPPIRATVALRTLNNRFTDLKLRLPAELVPRERELRTRILSRVKRGRVEMDLRLEGTHAVAPMVLNRPLVEAVLGSARVLRGEFGVGGDLDLSALLAIPGVFQQGQGSAGIDPETESAIFDALDAALAALDAERLREGAALRDDLLGRVRVMTALAGEIAARAPVIPGLVRDKLLERVRVLSEGAEPDPARVAQEAAFLADRADVTEELVRLEGHLAQTAALLEEPGGEPVGKRLDFLLQEINRETNTISSKSADLEMSRRALALKAETEKVREQVQNIE